MSNRAGCVATIMPLISIGGQVDQAPPYPEKFGGGDPHYSDSPRYQENTQYYDKPHDAQRVMHHQLNQDVLGRKTDKSI